ncbi:MAG: hypothetical protein MUO77_21315 [Anaerolineales bacterium]|nr:hypothetical protein [Anaerolineales bacterium]
MKRFPLSTIKRALAFAIIFLFITLGMALFQPPVMPVKAQQACNFAGKWETYGTWGGMSGEGVLTCSQSGSTVHCDYLTGWQKFHSTIDGTLSADGKTLTGTFVFNDDQNTPDGRVIMVLYGDKKFDGTWYHTDPKYGNNTSWSGERIGECVSAEDDYNPIPSDPDDNTIPPDPLVLNANCMDRSCEKRGCEKGNRYVLQEGELDEETKTCYINSPEIASFTCGKQGRENEYYICKYNEDACGYGIIFACEAGCDESTGQCLEVIGSDPNDNTTPPEPLEDCEVDCPYAMCVGDTSYYGDPVCKGTTCDYDKSDYCPNGCNDSTGYCYKLNTDDYPAGGDNSGDLLLTLLTGGAVIAVGGGVIGGGLAGLRALRRTQMIKARQLISQQAQQPSRFDSVEKSADQVTDHINELERKIESMERASLQHGLDSSVKIMESYHRSAAATEKIELLPRGIKWVADQAADIVGLEPTVGRNFKYIYHGVTTFIEKGIEEGVLSGVSNSAGKVLESMAGDKAGNLIKMKDVGEFPLKARVKDIVKETGMKTIGKNIIKDKWSGSAVKDAKGILRDLFGQ